MAPRGKPFTPLHQNPPSKKTCYKLTSNVGEKHEIANVFFTLGRKYQVSPSGHVCLPTSSPDSAGLEVPEVLEVQLDFPGVLILLPGW